MAKCKLNYEIVNNIIEKKYLVLSWLLLVLLIFLFIYYHFFSIDSIKHSLEKEFENNFEAFESYVENSALDDALKIESVTKKDNCIYFQLWSNRKAGRGVVYVEDGGLPQSTQIDWICKIYGERGWYVYQES